MRYAALLLNCLAIFLVGCGVFAAVDLLGRPSMSIRPSGVQLAPLPASLRSDQQRVAQALDAMPRIRGQALTHTATGSLIALPVPGSEVVGSVHMPRRSMSLYLDDIAAQTQMVVIDGQQVKQGARLEQGGRVAKVGSNEVIVTEQLGLQRLTLPKQELQVGTLRWPDGSLASINTQHFRPVVPAVP